MTVANYLNRMLGLKTEEEVALEDKVAALEAANAELEERNYQRYLKVAVALQDSARGLLELEKQAQDLRTRIGDVLEQLK